MATATAKAPKTKVTPSAKEIKVKSTTKVETGKSKGTTAPREPRAKKGGLRQSQVAVLRCLAKSNKPLSRGAIAEKTGVDLASLTGFIGSTNAEKRADHDKRYFVTLVTLGLVQHKIEEVGDKTVTTHVITAKGRQALAKLDK